jgi:hypothetical protein
VSKTTAEFEAVESAGFAQQRHFLQMLLQLHSL